MVQQTLNRPSNPSKPPNSGDGPEQGDSWDTVLAKLQSMLTEVYSKSVTAFAKYTTSAAAGPATAALGDLTGAQQTTCNYSAIGANNLTTRTAAQMFADHGAVVGQTYELEIMNSSGGTMTLVGGTGVTIAGVTTIANAAVRWYIVTFNSATTATIQNQGSGAI